MINLSSYKRMLSGGNSSVAQTHKKHSDLVMEATWDRDIQSKRCYIYDYYHDSEKDKYTINPAEDKSKTPVDVKFIVTQYGTLSKDQVEYHIQFKPSHECELDYFESYRSKYYAEYPIGLYIDIPDEKDVYRRWLICSRDYELDFVKYSVLPCNYNFHWVNNGNLYQMWGVARLRNSYNSGLWTDYLFTSVENQDQMWLPMNDISVDLYYDQRIVISVQALKEPLTWSISKPENIHPFGLNKLTLKQVKFDPTTDVKINGIWYADYNKSLVKPEPIDEYVENNTSSEKYILISPEFTIVKALGVPKEFTINTKNELGENITTTQYEVNFFIEDMVIPNEEFNLILDGNKTSICISDDTYLGELVKMEIKDILNDCLKTFEFEISGI